MKLAKALAVVCSCLLFQAVLLPGASAAEQGAPAKTSEETHDCKVDKAKVPTCKRPITQEARRQCRWKCGTECGGGKCIEICRGSGQECNGKIPPGW